ncbi:MAG: hypothetical protein AKCLJLPJ_02488 [Fimbriimonadales bacterium]|nr:hypothetical protein [Fimbriimonadales bacterium]
MPSWVETHQPYEAVSAAELRTGTVLRRVPFAVTPLGLVDFGSIDASGSLETVDLASVEAGAKVLRQDKVTVCSGAVMTPDCDIFQHKCNAVTVAQVLTVESYIELNGLKPHAASDLRRRVHEACLSNPGAFEKRGLFLLPGDAALGLENSFVLLENHVSIPIEFVSEGSGFAVSEESVVGQANIWFRIRHDLLRARLVNEYARQTLRVGLEDA